MKNNIEKYGEYMPYILLTVLLITVVMYGFKVHEVAELKNRNWVLNRTIFDISRIVNMDRIILLNQSSIELANYIVDMEISKQEYFEDYCYMAINNSKMNTGFDVVVYANQCDFLNENCEYYGGCKLQGGWFNRSKGLRYCNCVVGGVSQKIIN